MTTSVIKKETFIKKEEQQEVKSEPKASIKRERDDDDDADEDDFQIIFSRSIRFKPTAAKVETIKLESDTEDESRPFT